MMHVTREMRAVPSESDRPRLLLVEDEEALRTALERLLGNSFEVTACADGASAAALLVRERFDVVLTDIGLPGMTGTDLLRLVRTYDLDATVVLMTGAPDIESAIAAIDLGALTYLRKPFENAVVEAAVARAAKLTQLSRLKREANAEGIGSPLAGDRAGLEASFDRAISSLWVAFQPIVSVRSQRTVAFEALVRTSEATMRDPMTLLAAAERLERVHELGRCIRARAAGSFAGYDGDATLFVNLHPSDLRDDNLYDPRAPLSQMSSRVVLEVTERAAITDVNDAQQRASDLRRRGFRIAVDDLGAGYAGLSSLISLEPDIVKLDMSLIRGLESSPVRGRVVESITRLCRDLNMQVVAEGIETPGELGRVLDLGCDFLQGYLFGHPSRKPTLSTRTW